MRTSPRVYGMTAASPRQSFCQYRSCSLGNSKADIWAQPDPETEKAEAESGKIPLSSTFLCAGVRFQPAHIPCCTPSSPGVSLPNAPGI